MCVREHDSVHDLNEDLTSVSRKGANGNTGIGSHVCMFLFIQLRFHVTCTIKLHKLQRVKLSLYYNNKTRYESFSLRLIFDHRDSLSNDSFTGEPGIRSSNTFTGFQTSFCLQHRNMREESKQL